MSAATSTPPFTATSVDSSALSSLSSAFAAESSDSTTPTTTTSSAPSLTADIYVPSSTVTSGADPIYDLSLDSSQIERYGNYSYNQTTFLCTTGCRATVDNYGYQRLWRAIKQDREFYDYSAYIELNSLGNGTNTYTFRSINQGLVDWKNESARYRWFLSSDAGGSDLAFSSYFRIRINEWDYDTGLPSAGAAGTAQSSASPTSSISPNDSAGAKAHGGISGGAIAGIIIGVLGVLSIVGIVLFFARRRKRKRTKPRPGTHEKGIDNPSSSKPELVGSSATQRGTPYNKPELGATAKILPSELSSSEGARSIPYEGGAGAPPEPDTGQDKQLVESERLLPNLPEVRESQTGAPSSPTARDANATTAAMRITTNQENINALKAQERELSHKMEVSEQLQRMRAEHAALLDRIRIAEMQEREMHGG